MFQFGHYTLEILHLFYILKTLEVNIHNGHHIKMYETAGKPVKE